MNVEKHRIALSVVIVTLNEEFNIKRALDSLTWADEVLIYDSGSTDQTLTIAQKMGAKIISGDWLGFGSTKRKATLLAKNDWILSLDADEEVPEPLIQEIRMKFETLNAKTAYRIPRLSRFLGRWIRYGGWYPDAQIRLFNRQFANWDTAEIHERVEAKQIESLAQPFHHYVFKSIEHQVQTNNRYSSLQALAMHKKNRRFSWFHYLTKPSVKFLECYFLKRGILDGWVGYLIARNASYSVFLKWSKLKELREKE